MVGIEFPLSISFGSRWKRILAHIMCGSLLKVIVTQDENIHNITMWSRKFNSISQYLIVILIFWNYLYVFSNEIHMSEFGAFPYYNIWFSLWSSASGIILICLAMKFISQNLVWIVMKRNIVTHDDNICNIIMSSKKSPWIGSLFLTWHTHNHLQPCVCHIYS